jgi:predicted MFS family arabinose efflux permease
MNAVGTAIGGFLAQHFGPRWCFVLDALCVIVGFTIIMRDKTRLNAANYVASSKADLDALGDVSSIDK